MTHLIHIEPDQVAISYNDSGNSEVPLIFVHGFPFNKSLWTPQVNFFKATHRVLSFDIRGFGQSGSGTLKTSIRLYADDLIQFMDALNIEHAVVCGLSMGGYVMLNALSRYPERFQAVILSDTQCIADSEETKEKRYTNIKRIEQGGVHEFTESFLKNIFSDEAYQTKKGTVDTIRKMILSTSSQTLIASLKALAEREETCSYLSSINIPALIICGQEDKVTPPLQAEAIHKSLPHSTLKMIEKAGHLSNLEQPDAFNTCLKDFLVSL